MQTEARERTLEIVFIGAGGTVRAWDGARILTIVGIVWMVVMFRKIIIICGVIIIVIVIYIVFFCE